MEKVIKQKWVKNFTGAITMGLEEGYTQKPISKELVYRCISSFQNKLIEEENLYLSASVSECDILLSGQCEKHLQIRFINYPKFPIEKEVLKQKLSILAEQFMAEFKQNRIVVEYNDEIVMFDVSDEIDSRIKK